MRTDLYLERIGLAGESLSVDAASLARLQLRHLSSVPFENLDIHWRRPIALDTERFYKKIVEEARGGFCYELNGLFIELLRNLGFSARLISARVFDGERFTPEYDHAAIVVTLGELEYLADVGFGDFTAAPLRVTPDIEQNDREGIFVIRRSTEPGYLEVAKKRSATWTPLYMFSLLGRDLAEFAERCDFQQYSSESHFTKGKVCSLLTHRGRITLTDKKFIATSDGEKKETEVGTVGEFDELLRQHFGISERFQMALD